MIEKFKSKLFYAIGRLYKDDIILIERGGMEQACVARIYYYLQQAINEDEALSEYNLDCEYNKNGEEAKWYAVADTVAATRKRLARPDIVFHKRGHNHTNKVIIEFKGWWNNSHQSDIGKLKGFTNQNESYRYELGIFVKLNKTERGTLSCIVYYRDGKESAG